MTWKGGNTGLIHGVADEGPRLNHPAFADDVVIICQSSIGCQHVLG